MGQYFNAHGKVLKGFIVLYRNPFFGALGALRVLPRRAIVMQTSRLFKNGRRMRVPVNKMIGGIGCGAHLFLTNGSEHIFKLIRIYG